MPMRKFKNSIIIFLAVISLLSCSKAVKPSEDVARIKAILNTITKLQENYNEKDLAAFVTFVSPKYNSSFKNSVEKGLLEFDELNLTIHVDRINMDRDGAGVSLAWEGEWKKADKKISKSGNAIFAFTNDAEPKLTGISGNNPFDYYSISPIRPERPSE